MTNTTHPAELHQLSAAAAAHDAKGIRLFKGTKSGHGRARCSCGWLSEELYTSTARKAAHKAHREEIVTEPVVTEPVVTEPVVTEPVVAEPKPAHEFKSQGKLDNGYGSFYMTCACGKSLTSRDFPALVRRFHEHCDEGNKIAEPVVAEPETVVAENGAETPEVPVSGTFYVVWPKSVAKLFFRALAKDGADILATARGLTRQRNNDRMELAITGEPGAALELAKDLPGLFHDANEHLKQWRKTSPNYKQHSLATTEGRRDAFAAEQDYLRDFCRAVAGTFTPDQLASDGVQAGLAYVNNGE